MKHFSFIAIVELGLSHESPEKTSRHEYVKIKLVPSSNLKKDMYVDEDENITADGGKALTETLIHGLIGSIHMSHQLGIRDSAEHLQYIMRKLTEGFASVATMEKGTLDVDEFLTQPEDL